MGTPLYFCSDYVDNSLMIEQDDIFAHNQDSITFAELCNALYQRECIALGEYGPSQSALLKRKIKFLPQHVQECARGLLNSQAPLNVDYHNASYQHKQSSKCPSIKITAEQNQQSLSGLPDIGKVMCVEVKTLEGVHLELDSVDRIDSDNALIHVNKHGWFYTNGESQLADNNVRLVKSTKAILQAACAGHQWRVNTKGTPRALTLRELKLSFHIQW